MKYTLIASALLFGLAVSVAQAAPADASPTTAVASKSALALGPILQGAHRSAENKARDRYRHPAETLAFFEVQPNHAVLEITPGGGWYAEILSPALKDHGRYLAALNDPAKASSERGKEYSSKQNDALKAKFQGAPALYGKAEIVLFDAKAGNFGAPASVDRVLTFRNAHNWIGQGSEVSMFKGFYDVLKPGGVLGVSDHRAAPGTDSKVSAKTGYVTEASIIQLAEAAGFKLAGRSDVNANPNDTRTYENGVWTLPPVLALGDKDRAKYLAIGESDRMTLKFVKPAK